MAAHGSSTIGVITVQISIPNMVCQRSRVHRSPATSRTLRRSRSQVPRSAKVASCAGRSLVRDAFREAPPANVEEHLGAPAPDRHGGARKTTKRGVDVEPAVFRTHPLREPLGSISLQRNVLRQSQTPCHCPKRPGYRDHEIADFLRTFPQQARVERHDIAALDDGQASDIARGPPRLDSRKAGTSANVSTRFAIRAFHALLRRTRHVKKVGPAATGPTSQATTSNAPLAADEAFT